MHLLEVHLKIQKYILSVGIMHPCYLLSHPSFLPAWTADPDHPCPSAVLQVHLESPASANTDWQETQGGILYKINQIKRVEKR